VEEELKTTGVWVLRGREASLGTLGVWSSTGARQEDCVCGGMGKACREIRNMQLKPSKREKDLAAIKSLGRNYLKGVRFILRGVRLGKL